MSSYYVKAGVAGVILRGNQIVMVRRKYGTHKGKWCIPCGNIGVGEDVRVAVSREIKEETGLDVEVGGIVDVLSTHHSLEQSVVGIWFLVKEKGGNLVAGDDASEVQLFPLDEPPADMAFEADRKIIERLKATNLLRSHETEDAVGTEDKCYMQITYQDTTDGIGSDNLNGFFVGWPNPPSPETHLRILKGSDYVILAVSSEGKVIGFISAISDGVSCAYIPHLEVLPEWQGKGIGSELVRRLVRKLKDLYMIDLICDQEIQRFYERLGFEKARGMIVRNFEQQACD